MQPTIAKLLAVLAIAVTPAVADTVHGVVVYSRHGDRMFEVQSHVCLMLIDVQEPRSSIKDTI